jgi:hypothetical protein
MVDHVIDTELLLEEPQHVAKFRSFEHQSYAAIIPRLRNAGTRNSRITANEDEQHRQHHAEPHAVTFQNSRRPLQAEPCVF